MPIKKREEGISKTIWRTFTKDESKRIVKAVKERLGRDYTITNLSQAALLLAVLKMNPPGPETPNSQVYNCPTPINGRRFLQEPYQSYAVPYFPSCQCNGFILFEDIKSYTENGMRNNDETKELLKKAATISRDGYAAILKRPNNLAISTPVMELFAMVMAQ